MKCILCGEELAERKNSCLSWDVSYDCDNKDCSMDGVILTKEQANALDDKRENTDSKDMLLDMAGLRDRAYENAVQVLVAQRDEARQVARRMKRERDEARGIMNGICFLYNFGRGNQ